MPRPYKWWTEQEIEFLKTNYPTTSAKIIGEELGRSKATVATKVCSLGLKSELRRKPWSDYEIEVLKSKFHLPRERLLNLLPNRSLDAILDKTKRCGLSRRYEVHKREMGADCGLTRREATYIAGVMDGEGTISIHKEKRSPVAYYPRLGVVNTSLELMLWLKKKLHFNIPQKLDKGRRESWKTCYCGTLSGYKVYPLLKRILPSLIVKRKQAELVIAFLEERLKHVESNLGYTGEEIQLYKEVRALNKRGLPL